MKIFLIVVFISIFVGCTNSDSVDIKDKEKVQVKNEYKQDYNLLISYLPLFVIAIPFILVEVILSPLEKKD